jgi:PAS domain S-box-containing protein
MSLPLRVLIVDDNPGDAELVEILLSELPGYSMDIHRAQTLSSACRKAKEEAFDLVLLDLGLPDSQGTETFSRFKPWFPRGTVIVLSGDSDEEVALSTVRQGAQDFLVKGQFDSAILRRALRYSLERQRIESDLRARESRWATLVQAVPVGITELDLELKVKFFNTNAMASGISVQEGRLWSEGLSLETRPPIEELLELALKGQQNLSFTNVKEKAGQYSYYEHLLGPILDSGKVLGLLVATSDVTANKQSEIRALRDIKSYQTLMKLYELDPEVDLFEVALRDLVEITGSLSGVLCFYSDDKNILVPSAWAGDGTLPWDLPPLSQGVRLGPENLWTDALSKRTPLLANTPDSALGVRFLLVPVQDQGKTVLAVGLAGKSVIYDQEDVREVVRLTEGLWNIFQRRKEEAEHRKLLSAIECFPMAIALVNQHSQIEYINPQFVSLTGISLLEATGADLSIVHVEGAASPSYQQQRMAIEKGDNWKAEFPTRGKGGQSILLNAWAFPLSGVEGHSGHFVAVYEDITQKRLAEESLAQARKMESVGQLAAGMAHDLNNILSTVLSNNSVILLKLPPEHPARLFSQRIEVAVKRASELVSGLLAYGRRRDSGIKRTELNSYILEEAELLQALVRPPVVLNIRLLQATLPVDLDKSLFGQVVMNLVSNACDAVKETGGTVEISTDIWEGKSDTVETTEHPGGGRWFVLTIADSGPGIPLELHSRIFEPFFTTKEVGKGTGIGLAMVWGIVEQHGAKIKLVCPKEGKTQFKVFLRESR